MLVHDVAVVSPEWVLYPAAARRAQRGAAALGEGEAGAKAGALVAARSAALRRRHAVSGRKPVLMQYQSVAKPVADSHGRC